MMRRDPRANQKARTRASIIEAARRLRQGGAEPTVAEAAEEARVSRATAYRYFPTQEALIVELDSVGPRVREVEEIVAGFGAEDAGARLGALMDAFGAIVLREEEPFRRALRVYLDTWLRGRRGGNGAPAVREGRRMRWLDAALEPLAGLPDERLRRLRAALALTIGVDAMVVMKDVCRLDDEEALATLRWAAEALLAAALAEEAEPG